MPELSKPAKIAKHVSKQTLFTVSCAICGDEDTEENVRDELYAGCLFFDRGWRYTNRPKRDIDGVICPKCRKEK